MHLCDHLSRKWQKPDKIQHQFTITISSKPGIEENIPNLIKSMWKTCCYHHWMLKDRILHPWNWEQGKNGLHPSHLCSTILEALASWNRAKNRRHTDKKNKLSSFTNNLITYIEDRWEIYRPKKKRFLTKVLRSFLGKIKVFFNKRYWNNLIFTRGKKMNLPHTIHKNKIKVI